MVPFRLLLLSILAVLCMSAVPVLVKSTSANEFTIAVARLIIAVAVMSPLVLWRKRLSALSRAEWQALVLIGLVFIIHWLTYFLSIKLSTASIGALAVSTFGVQYLFLAWLFNGEQSGLVEWLAVLCCLVGCVVVVPEFTLESGVTQGMLVGVFAGTLYACLPLLHQRAKNIDTVTRAWGQFSFALLFLIPFLGYTDWQLTTNDYYKLLTLGILSTVIAHGLWVKVSTELPAVFTSLVYYLYVPMAMVSSAWFLDEEMTGRKVIGAILILGSSAWITFYRWRKSAY